MKITQTKSTNNVESNFITLIYLIVCMAGILLLYVGHNQRKDSVKVSATISQVTKGRDADGDKDYDAYVNYKYEGKEYKDVHLSYYSMSMKEGKEIKIHINPDNPTKVYASSYLFLFGWFCIIMGAIGLYAMNLDVIRYK